VEKHYRESIGIMKHDNTNKIAHVKSLREK